MRRGHSLDKEKVFSLWCFRQGEQLFSAPQDGSFDYELRSPSVSWFLKQAAGLEKGSGRAGHEAVAAVSAKDIYEIARIKQGDPNQAYIPLDRIADSIMGTARSMGIEVKTGDGT